MQVSQKFERLLDAYRQPDGSCWAGQQLDEATDGIVARAYFTNLKKGRIASPGYEKMKAIAKAMGFPSEAWFEESSAAPFVERAAPGGSSGRYLWWVVAFFGC
jgi:hypothetical protein